MEVKITISLSKEEAENLHEELGMLLDATPGTEDKQTVVILYNSIDSYLGYS